MRGASRRLELRTPAPQAGVLPLHQKTHDDDGTPTQQRDQAYGPPDTETEEDTK